MRLIDADQMAIDESKAYLSAQCQIKDELAQYVNAVVHTKIQRLIADTPTVDAAPLVHERWIDRDRRLSCPVCGNQVHLGTDDPLVREIEKFKHKFCFNCGAKMDEVMNNENK